MIISNNVAYFQGNQSGGVSLSSPTISVLRVNELSAPIAPEAGTDGILFHSLSGGNVTLEAGASATNVVVRTRSGDGIHLQSEGIAPYPRENPVLGIPIPGDNVPGGVVQVRSYSDIATEGDDAHGIRALSYTTGYPQAVIDDLNDFNISNITFSVASVVGSAGNIGQPVSGVLIDTNGLPVAGDGGTCVITEAGTYLFDPGTAFTNLAEGAERTIRVDYEMLLSSAGGSITSSGYLLVTAIRTNGSLAYSANAYFPDYGVRQIPEGENTVLPDLQGYVDGLIADAAAGGAGNNVTVMSAGALTTSGPNSHGILAESRGASGSTGSTGSISHSAGAGGLGRRGGDVEVTANGSISTAYQSGTVGEASVGIVAHSQAGNGGQGGDGGSGGVRWGATGGTGGTGGDVTVRGSATIHTAGDYGSGILAFSEGGNGGAGGSGHGAMGGGNGGYGGMGGTVTVDGSWDVLTEGDRAHGIWAKSLGGNAGAGGGGGWLFGKPGGGGPATDGGAVTVSSDGAIETMGNDSFGIYAQSVGGFGGSGGTGGSIFYSAGGDGNSAGSGGEVSVTQLASGSITTHGTSAHALFAQSIGGGGGSGGGAGAIVASGGAGAPGGNGGRVVVSNDGQIRTLGTNAHGIYAQSIGGGGGDGGSASGLGAIGGRGSGTSDGGNIMVTNTGQITIAGERANAIFAESIGGGGGDGGSSTGWFSVGGAGGGGGNASNVVVINQGQLETRSSDSSAIFAQSVGGGGGNGGGAISAGAFGSLAIGGSGGTGGDAGNLVKVRNDAAITTAGDRSHGIFSQSVGGGGGNGGYAVSVSVGTAVSLSVALGGDGAGGGDGKTVLVDSTSDITTQGNDSHGVFAQSVGGGGGSGGFSIAFAGSAGGISGSVSLGGKGAGGGDGGRVIVGDIGITGDEHFITGDIATLGNHSYGVLAQSVGGGGGDGGFSIAGGVGSTGVAVGLGGSGGVGGVGGDVDVRSKSRVTTQGKDAHGIVAQSIGGGGGSGGFSIAGTLSGLGAAVSLGGAGGTGNTGGEVYLDSRGDISTGIAGKEQAPLEDLEGLDSTLLELLRDNEVQSIFQLSTNSLEQLTAIPGIAQDTATDLLEKARQFMEKGDHAYGILAQSVGGSGGDGGFSVGAAIGMGAGAFSMGGAGGDGGVGGAVEVHSESSVITHGKDAHGIVAQSVGGGGGSGGFSVAGALTAGDPSGGAAASLGGSGGTGNTGGHVTLSSTGTIQTSGNHAYGLLAQSVGGGGGDGGFSVGAATGKGAAAFSMGGSGGDGGTGGDVEVHSQSQVLTMGTDSHGIVAQSVGGGGGSGGFSVAGSLSSVGGAAVSLGGSAGSGNSSGHVTLDSQGDIFTLGERAYGILAQSVGGGGGDGGFSVAGTLSTDGTAPAFSMGGNGGQGGSGGDVDLSVQNNVYTFGQSAHAILAQSIGGGGGSGGFSVAGSISVSSNMPSVAVSIGGAGGFGGNASNVTVTSTGQTIATQGDRSYGILAQSLGGGGGDGGFSVAGGISRSHNVSFSLGGSGGSGGAGGLVDLDNATRILTQGSNAHGIFAQSVGGGGGNGGFSVAGTLSTGNSNSLQVAVSIGGEGGEGSYSTNVQVRSAGDISTRGQDSSGIFAQSVGGGGGNGGFSFAGTLGRSGANNLSVSVGGGGGGGGVGGNVDVSSSGVIDTSEENSHGIFAQSLGGGGGNGGMSLAVDFGLSNTNSRNINVAVAVGGGGGGGALAGAVDVLNQDHITTRGASAHGILAQSIGGGGGNGGFSLAGTFTLEAKDAKQPVNVATAIGGQGGTGNLGGAVSVENSGAIDTYANGSSGVYAQSIGGGGGTGGASRAIVLDVNPTDWIPKFKKDGLGAYAADLFTSWNIAVGGDGGDASHGGLVTVTNSGEITTRGTESYGIFAQSIGGGGGWGGDASHGIPEVPTWLEPFLELTPLKGLEDMQIVVGGSGGSSGNGEDVNIGNTGDITTMGDGSSGIFAQSIGGGGGVGGSGALGLIGNVGIGGAGGASGNGGQITVIHEGQIDTYGAAAHGILAQSVGGGGGLAGNVNRGVFDFGVGFAYSQPGGSAGDGGEVTVLSTGNITTSGSGANGIFAQSVGGGGGLAGDVGLGIGFAGSVGGDGSGDTVTVTHTGDILTLGNNAHGIVAQSAGGKDFGGDVDITVAGNIIPLGSDSMGIFAQSRGDQGAGNISITILSGLVSSGLGSNAAVRFADGAENRLRNYGTITTWSGVAETAVLGGNANEIIHNYGVINGSVDLGAGQNGFNNYQGATFNSGATVNLGYRQALINSGTVSPGGPAIVATILTGDFVQTGTGSFVTGLGSPYFGDLLAVRGTASLDGTLSVLSYEGYVPKKGTQFAVLTATEGVTGEFVKLNDPYKGNYAIQLDLVYLEDRVIVQTLQDKFLPFARTENQRAVAKNLDRLSEDVREVRSIDYLNAVPGRHLPGSLDLIAPEELGAMFDVSIGAAGISAGSLQHRLKEIRAGSQGFSGNLALFDPRGRIDYASLANGAEPATERKGLTSMMTPSSTNRWGVFAAGSGEFTDVENTRDAAGYDFKTAGVTLGVDYRVRPTLAAGIRADYVSIDADLTQGGCVDVQGVKGGVFATWFNQGYYVDAAAGGGYNAYDTRRATLGGKARGSTYGYEWEALVGCGYDVEVGDLTVGPMAAVEYTLVEIDHFQETGSMTPLEVEDNDSDSLRSRLGARATYEWTTRRVRLIPEIRVAWQHECLDKDRAIDARYASGAGGSFRVHSPQLGRDSLSVATGLVAQWSTRISSYLYYYGDLARDNYSAHTLSGGLSASF